MVTRTQKNNVRYVRKFYYNNYKIKITTLYLKKISSLGVFIKEKLGHRRNVIRSVVTLLSNAGTKLP